jgi:tousled-like kinase
MTATSRTLDPLSPVDRRLLLQQRLAGKDPSDSLGAPMRDPAASQGLAPESHPAPRRPPPAAPTEPCRSPSTPDSHLRSEIEREMRDEYESKLERLRGFTLDFLQAYVEAHQEVETMELVQAQQRLGTIATFVSGTARWSGGLEVERVDRQIESLGRRLADFKSQKGVVEPILAQRKATLNFELKEQRAIRKQLEDERRDLGIRLRVAGDLGQSEYKLNQTLGDGQYALVRYLGRGGFSEVWLAFDVTEIRNVALKIQRMNPQWPRSKKEDFVRHSGREIKILQSAHHENVVRFYGHFYIDDNTVAMVMEYCAGGDLAAFIRKRGKLPEKEARLILIQVLEGLLALRSKDSTVVHYDLKPANILFNEEGVVKLTDFGLSKIVEPDEVTFELTSQGPGTYYYAAPETFLRVRGEPLRISQSVDTWSLGIIYYEMLFGQRPFGDEATQPTFPAQIEGLLGRLVFPQNVKVTEQCRAFILACLERDPAVRPVPEEIWKSEYLQQSFA